jgi:hypothetical protein
MRRRQERFSHARFPRLLFWSAIPLLVVGCGSGKIGTYPVTGTVNLDGKPAEGAIVIFCPTEGSEQFKRERPFGKTGPDGKFELTTFVANDGAPAGDYKVMIRWPTAEKALSASEDPNRPTSGSGGGDRLDGKYFNPQQSGLTAKVARGQTELPPFELKTK